MPTYLPWLFSCWECEKSHEMVDGNYVVEKNDPPLGPKDTKFFCIPCAEKVWGKESVGRVLAAK